MAVLGLSEVAETIGLELFRQMVDRLRQVTYATSQDQDDVLSLTYCTQSGFGRDRPIIGVEPEGAGGNPGYPFSFDDAEIFADIQYALSSATFTSRSATGNEVGSITLGGGTTPGAPQREGAILIAENGEVTLSGRVLSLACWTGSDLDADDELVVSINGTEFERLTTGSLRANFLATDVTWTTSEILDRLGTPFVAGDVYTMTVTRTRALTDDHLRYCDEQLMGPAMYELFSVDLVTDDGAGLDLSAFRGTYAGTCAEVESGTCNLQEYEGPPIPCWATVDAIETGLRVRFTHQHSQGQTGCPGDGWRFDEFLVPADIAPVVAIPLQATFRGSFCDNGVTVINRDYALEPAAQPPHLRGEITADGTFMYEYEASMSDFCLYYRPVVMDKCADNSLESTGATPPCP